MGIIVQTDVDIGIRINRIQTEGNIAVTMENIIFLMKDRDVFHTKNKLAPISHIWEEKKYDECKNDD